MTSTRLIRINEVKRRTGLSRSSIYKQVAEGTFPAPVHISERAVAWIEERIKQRGGKS